MPSSDSTVFWVIIAAVLFAILLALVFAAVYFLTRHAFHVIFDRPSPRPAYDRSPKEIKQDTIYGRGQNWFYSNRLEFQDLTIASYDRHELFAYYRPAQKKDTKLLVVLVHGWRDTPSNMAAFAQMYLEKTDCHILIPHLRAHGMSGGRYIGFGLPDSQDLLMWTAYMEKHLQGPLSTLYHGWSMGAATVLIAAGSGHLPTSVIGIVADSPYDSLDHQLQYRLRQMYHFSPGVLLRGISRFTQKKLGYPISRISPIARADRISVPVLLIHGTADTFVPPNMSDAIFERIQSPKRILLVKDAEHVMSYDAAPSIYSSEIDQFMRACGISEVPV